MATGDIITAPVQRTSIGNQWFPDIIHRDGDIFAIAYGAQAGGPNQVRTVRVNDDGTFALLGAVTIHANWTNGYCFAHVYGNVYAVAQYWVPPAGNTGWIDTVSISADGATLAYINGPGSFSFVAWASETRIVQVTTNIFAVTFINAPNQGRIQIVYINPGGVVLNNRGVATYAPVCWGTSKPVLISSDPVTGSVIAIAYAAGLAGPGRVTTIHISVDGNTVTPLANLDFDAVVGASRTFALVHMLGNVYAILYQDNGNHGRFATVSISQDGLTLGNLNSFEPGDNDYRYLDLVAMGGYSNIVVGFYEQLAANTGWMKSIYVSDDGLTLLTHDTSNWLVAPNTILHQRAAKKPDTSIYVLVYHPVGVGAAYLATFDIQSTYVPRVQTLAATEVT